jgi:hypothetical protein
MSDILLSDVFFICTLPRVKTEDIVITGLFARFERYPSLAFHNFVVITFVLSPKEDVEDAVDGFPGGRNPKVCIWHRFCRSIVRGRERRVFDYIAKSDWGSAVSGVSNGGSGFEILDFLEYWVVHEGNFLTSPERKVAQHWAVGCKDPHVRDPRYSPVAPILPFDKVFAGKCVSVVRFIRLSSTSWGWSPSNDLLDLIRE